MSQPKGIILIVDDEPLGRKALESALLGQGYELMMADDGAEALATAARTPPDLVLLDVMMPGMDGIEVCYRLRSDRGLAEVPILLVTALDDRDTRIEGLRAGADDFLTKPLDRAEVRARVDTITRLNRYRKIVDSHLELLAAYDATLEAWARLLELRDRETQGHTRRVTEAAVRLGAAAGIAGDDLVQMRRGALLHDIGKIGIPDAILLKPGPLTDEETEVVKTHPRIAHDMLSGIPFLRPMLDIPYCHHENYDGTGYPRGLAGPAIPLSARLFSVVDVWDALSQDRIYRDAWPRQRVDEHLRRAAGKQLDPDAVRLFLELQDRGDIDQAAEAAHPVAGLADPSQPGRVWRYQATPDEPEPVGQSVAGHVTPPASRRAVRK